MAPDPGNAATEGIQSIISLLAPLQRAPPQTTGLADALLASTGFTEAGLPAKCVCYCMTTMRRSWQIRMTLAWNVIAIWPYRHNATLVVGDFNQDDELCQWILDNFAVPLSLGVLRLWRSTAVPFWHASVCKNAVHEAAMRMFIEAGGELDNLLLMNLDNDRIIGSRQPAVLLRSFTSGGQLMHLSNSYDEGSYGMVGVAASLFRRAGGYDEAFLPSGCQDTTSSCSRVRQRILPKGQGQAPAQRLVLACHGGGEMCLHMGYDEVVTGC